MKNIILRVANKAKTMLQVSAMIFHSTNLKKALLDMTDTIVIIASPMPNPHVPSYTIYCSISSPPTLFPLVFNVQLATYLGYHHCKSQSRLTTNSAPINAVPLHIL